MFRDFFFLCTFVLCLCWRVDGYTEEEDAHFEQFVRFALNLREKFFEAGGEREEKVFGSGSGATQEKVFEAAGLRQEKVFGSGAAGGERQEKVFGSGEATSRQRRQTRSGPGFYALPLPYLPQVENDF